jgi:hypothetical protein
MGKAAPFKIEWEAHEYEHKERSPDWFWAVGIISVAVAITSIIFGNVIFGILVIIATFSLALFINREPSITHASLNERGITRGKMHYPYSTLDSYWIDVEHPHKKILLKSKKLFMPLIIVPISDEVDPEALDDALIQHLPREFHNLSIVEQALEYLGF